MIYLALGDSITHGYDATDNSHQYVNQLVDKLNQFKRTSVYVHAKPGWSSLQLLKSLDRIPQCILEEAGLISLLIGGNDLIKAVPWFLDNKESAIERLRTSYLPQVKQIVKKVKINPQTPMLLCTIYNPFPNSDVSSFAIAGLNDILRSVAQQENCELVPVDHYYGGNEQDLVSGYRRGELEDFRLFKNPIHPNDLGHARIADAVFSVASQLERDRLPDKRTQNSNSKKRQRSLKRV